MLECDGFSAACHDILWCVSWSEACCSVMAFLQHVPLRIMVC